ncbi:dethiobiotin synthase [Ilyomonas limi]|uniref:ATP-dependent dethiobiotin synthetase BioD n=1 Tax=Ilyomonas limi TaxID=2575867 RepID=A0A4U3LAS5_9BACT|nr:dethiobiotin synthase [Ilyomonas limi]TKK71809.1 dethiobiotin synthase [Ilyomonas limi]
MKPIFITGIGTGVGKTVAAAIITEALQANYWKPVQAGFDDGTDTLTVKELISNTQTVIFPEVYKLQLPASPHIAAREENITIDIAAIYQSYSQLATHHSHHSPLIIEGAGGLLVPLNESEFIIDLIKKLDARVILVSRNYLGSINHSLLTAAVCKANNLDVAGWLFNDQYLHYESEIEKWSGYKKIGAIPAATIINKALVREQAMLIKDQLKALL